MEPSTSYPNNSLNDELRTRKLEEVESRLRALFENSNNAVLVLENRKIVQYNGRLRRIFETEEPDSYFIGKSLYEISPQYQPDGVSSCEKIESAIKHCERKSTYTFDWRFLRPDGSEFQGYVALTHVPYRDKSLMMLVVRDMTERELAARMMEHSRAYLAVLAETRRFFYGRSEEDIIQIFLENSVHHFGFSKAWYGVYSGNAVLPHFHSGGAKSFIDLDRADMERPNNDREGWLSSSRLSFSENNAESTPAIAREVLFPLSRAIIEKQPIIIENLETSPEFAPWRTFALSSRSRSILAIPLEVEGRTEGGFVFYSNNLKAFDSPVSDYMQSAIAELSRILSRKRIWEKQQLDLREAKDKAEAASQAKMRFIAGISHEIRTPMTAILGYAEMLLDPDISLEQYHAIARTIHDNGEYLMQILNDTLDFSKLESSKLLIDWQEVSTAKLLEEIVSFYGILFKEKSLLFELVASTGIPESFRTDPYRVKQILFNLIGNALKFTNEGGITLRISWEEAPEIRIIDGNSSEPADSHPSRITGTLRFDVIDTGVGIPPEVQEAIFQPFNQGKSSTAATFGGSGLGLAISSRAAELLEGKIALESVPGSGSCFSLLLPLSFEKPVKMIGQDDLPRESDFLSKHDFPKPPEVLPDLPQVESPKEPLAGKRILLLEDAEDNLRLFERILRLAGAEIVGANNGQSALEIVLDNNETFDAILMDIQMPIMDGITATKILRDRGYVRPIIALTARASGEHSGELDGAGFDSCISKPILRKDLIEAVRRACIGG